MTHFQEKGYITSSGKIKDTMKNALKNGTLDLPKNYEAAREHFTKIIMEADRKPPIIDASCNVVVVYLIRNGEEKMYFILETKGSTNLMDLRTKEQLKIHYDKKHFEVLENGISMEVATDWKIIKFGL